LNIQFAIQNDQLYVIEANPRASRTIPFISKATGIPFVKKAVRVSMGASLEEVGLSAEPEPSMIHVKAAVFPFKSFPREDPLLGPQMRSTGEVMGRDVSFGAAFAKAMIASGMRLPQKGSVFISVNTADKEAIAPIAEGFHELGFTIFATRGTRAVLEDQDIPVTLLRKIASGRPNVLDAIKNGDVNLIINTPLGATSFDDDSFIRIEALRHHIPCLTTLSAAEAALEGIAALQNGKFCAEPIQG
jgi:carbamoyl-phosphate synthase large subunit